jgi:hypothetical protein
MTTRWVRGISRDMMRTLFRDWFGVQDNQADVLVTLYQAGGQALHRRALCLAINQHRPPTMGALHERIRVLRSAMETESIDFDEETGYRLSEIGLEECRKAVQQMGRVLAEDGPLIPVIEPEEVMTLGPKSDRLRRKLEKVS